MKHMYTYIKVYIYNDLILYVLDLYVYIGTKVPHVRDDQPRPTVQSYPPRLYLWMPAHHPLSYVK